MKHFWLLAMVLAIGLTSCVSKRKYDDELAARMATEQRENQLQQESTSLRSQLSSRIEQYNQAARERDSLQSTLRSFTDQALTQQQRLDLALQNQQRELERREQIINDLQTRIQQREQMMNTLLSTVQNALRQFSSEELSVDMRDGKVYVSLSEGLLFPSGSAAVNPRGKEALGTLANVLRQQPDMEILVEGHTDSIPIRSGTFKDNWDLSVIRATSVVRILTKDYGVSPQQVTAAGQGEFEPRTSNATPQGRAMNRRTEIIIQPKLDEIYQAIQETDLSTSGGG